MRHFDTVVIGAGNAGLTSATALQRGGSRTLLLERHNIPGGCATSFVRGNFEFEVALHQLSGLGTEKHPFVMRKLFADLGVMDKVEFIQEHALYRLVVPGEIDISLPASVNGVKAKLAEHFPHEQENVERFLTLCEKISMEGFMGLPRARAQNDEALLLKSCPNYVKYGFRNAKDVVDEFIRDPKLRCILSAYWLYVGVPPREMPFADLAVMIYSYLAFKPWHIRGGSQALSSALLASFQEAGGEVQFNCGVEKIRTEQGKVCSVVLETGEEVRCNAVISNASPLTTFNELLDAEQAPLAVQQDFKSRRMGTSAFVIYMGLDCTPEELGVETASSFIYESMNEDDIHDRMQTLDAPNGGMLTCYNFEDRDAALEGKSQVALVCLQYGDVWENIPEDQYAKTKYEFAESLISMIEKVYPNVRKHIEEVEVATPLTMMRYLNTPGGAIYGFKQSIEDNALLRERLAGVPGLFIAGSWSGMGGFQPTYMSGAATAKAAIKYVNQQQGMAHV